MNKVTIQHLYSLKQGTKEGIYTMKGLALTNLLHTLIREYGAYHDGSYSVDAKDLSLSDMRLILSYVLDSGEYEWASFNNERLEGVYLQTINVVQTLLDSESHAVYCEDMEEMGMVRVNSPNNNEIYWIRR